MRRSRGGRVGGGRVGGVAAHLHVDESQFLCSCSSRMVSAVPSLSRRTLSLYPNVPSWNAPGSAEGEGEEEGEARAVRRGAAEEQEQQREQGERGGGVGFGGLGGLHEVRARGQHAARQQGENVCETACETACGRGACGRGACAQPHRRP